MPKKDWFDEWFNTIYYHILYQNRDYKEAAKFLDQLIQYFGLSKETRIMDLACGKGRHSIYLNDKGFDVTGVDLSQENIKHASQFANEHLRFAVHDMREVYTSEQFNYIFNLFTSFGYFDTKEENLGVIDAAIQSLKPRGKLLIDFLNPYMVINNLVAKETKEIDGIKFHIERKYTSDEYIIKNIRVEDHGQTYDFQEKVKALRRTDFLDYFKQINLKVIDLFGDYSLAPYDSTTSDRLIFIVEK